MLRISSQGEELGGRMSPPMRKHLELEIKILKNAPRDADKLRKLLKVQEGKKKKLGMGEFDRSLLQGEGFELFSAAIKSAATRDPYERKLLGFLKRINLSPDAFVQFAKDNPSAAERRIISLLSTTIPIRLSDDMLLVS
jgi:hypothetical protein